MKKSIFLFFAAILCAIGMNAADTYYFRGGHNSWGDSDKMTTSTDGHYVYYHINDISMGQGKEFKINKNNADSWDQSHYDIVNNYNGTDLKITASDNRSISAAGYVILYLPNTLVNPSNKAILCASTKLTDGIEQVFLKHPWNGGGWEYCNALTKNSSGKLVITKKYGSAGCNWSMKKEAWHEKWVATPTLVNEPQTGDDCEFAFDPADQTITITKQLTKNIGSITITMACDQHPNIYYYGGVDGSVTYPEWPGVNMTDNGDGTYSYKVDNVNLDLGLDYVITLKEVNANEWKSADLNAKANVSHDVSIFNFPKIVVLGIDGKWDDTNALTEVSNDYLTVSKTISFAEAGSHNLKCHVGSAQYQGGSVVDITRANPSSNKFDKDYGGDGKFTADINGDYVFTWTYKTGTLSVTYPELPTPEYKDITIQVYAKEVPNIWWWNGGDQCLSTEEIVNPSTGNKYQWNEAPAMEKVAGEDNWYTKTFENVDITKGGIKFKLQSTDHSTSTTNEVVTTEDKCYDARVIATVKETTCGELPSGEVPTVTYNVTVPTGTPACYIAGAMNSWSHQAMTRVDETHYTITIEGAEKTQEYKYSASNNWDLVELNEDGSEKANRIWTENDVVAKWKEPAPAVTKYYVKGSHNSWTADATSEMTLDGAVYKKEVTLAADVEFKINDGADAWWGKENLGGKTYAELEGLDGGNLKMKEGKTFTVIFDPANNLITFTGLTETTPAVQTITYVLMGVNGDWDNGIALTQKPDNADEYVLENQVIIKATDAVKVVTLTDGTATAWCGNVDTWSNATYTADVDGNIVLEDGIYTFYFKKNDDLIYINQTGYARNVTNKYGTICLPYASASTTGATFYRVAGKEEVGGAVTGVVLENVDALEAGVPYVFEANANQIKVVYTGEKANNPVNTNANGLVGTFTNETVVDDGDYILYNNQFCPSDGTSKVNAYRAYLEMDAVNAGEPTRMPGRRYIGMGVQGENAVTGLEDIIAPEGQTIKVIENGQLIIIRDGEMYNAMGVKL